MKKISAQEFTKILLGVSSDPPAYSNFWRATNNGIEIHFENYAIEGVLDFPRNKSIHFSKCELKNVKLEDGNVNRIVFHDSKVQSITIINSQISNLQFGYYSQINHLYFAGNVFVDNVTIHTQTTFGSVLITANSNISQILIDHATINEFRIEETKCSQLSVRNSSINQSLGIVRVSEIQSFIFADSIIKDVLDIFDSQIENCELIGSQLGKVDILHSSASKLDINNSTIGWIGLKESKIVATQIVNSKAVGVNVTYMNAESKRLVIRKSLFESIVITIDRSYEIILSECTIWALSLSKKVFPKDAILRISDCKFNEILIDSFTNQGYISFNNIIPFDQAEIFKSVNNKLESDPNGLYILELQSKPSELRMINSDLGKTNFIGCDLNQFSKFIFLNSKLLEIFIAGTLLPQKEKIGTISNSGAFNTKFEQSRLALSQFKKIYENRGDVVMGIEYHAQEMEIYRHYLKHSNPSTRTERWNVRGERMNLWLNRTSSYYGNNWLRAVGITLLVNWFLFTIYCLTLGYIPGTNYSKFWELFSYSFEFLNPIRKTDILSKDISITISPLSRIIDYVSRIAIAYCVYQTIQAFRKFGKKSA